MVQCGRAKSSAQSIEVYTYTILSLKLIVFVSKGGFQFSLV